MKKSVHRDNHFGYPNKANFEDDDKIRTRDAKNLHATRKHKSVYETLNLKEKIDAKSDYKRLSESSIIRGLPTRNKFSYDLNVEEMSRWQDFKANDEERQIKSVELKHDYIKLYGSYKSYNGDHYDDMYDTKLQTTTNTHSNPVYMDGNNENIIDIDSIQIKDNEYCEIENVPTATPSVRKSGQQTLRRDYEDQPSFDQSNTDQKLRIRLTVQQKIIITVIITGIISLLAVGVVIAVLLSAEKNNNESVFHSTSRHASTTTIKPSSPAMLTQPVVTSITEPSVLKTQTTIAITSKEEMLTTLSTVPPIQDVSCNDSFVMRSSGPVHIVCSFKGSFSSMNITFRSSLNSPVYRIGIVYNDSKVTDLNNTDDILISFTIQLLTITIQNATCFRRGYYGVSLDFNGYTLEAEGIFSFTSKPERPKLIENHDTIEGGHTWVVTCTGKTGYPVGSMQVLYKKTTDVIFSEINEEYLTRQKGLDCNNHETVTVTMSLTSDLNNTLIKCVSRNNKTVEDGEDLSIFTSNLGRIILIEDSYCSTNESYKFHPRGCRYYVQCNIRTGMIYSRNNCHQSTPCFNFIGKHCDFCENVSHSC